MQRRTFCVGLISILAATPIRAADAPRAWGPPDFSRWIFPTRGHGGPARRAERPCPAMLYDRPSRPLSGGVSFVACRRAPSRRIRG